MPDDGREVVEFEMCVYFPSLLCGGFVFPKLHN